MQQIVIPFLIGRNFLPARTFLYLFLAWIFLLPRQAWSANDHFLVDPPVITCPGDVTLFVAGNNCTGTVILPGAVATDDSPSPVNVNATSALGSGLGPFFNVPVGMYTVTYIATDVEGLMDTCSIKLYVFDTVPPTLVCSQLKVVSLNATGKASVPAEQFLKSLNDNCKNTDSVDIRRMDSLVFKPSATFSCEDVGDTLMLVVRGFDFSGNSNTCMVQALVQDKQPPLLSCPANVTTSCQDFLANPEAYGTATAADSCGIDTFYRQEIRNLSNCNTGTVQRIFTAVDVNGNIAQCTQTIQVVNSDPFGLDDIDWPEDLTVTSCTPKSQLTPDKLAPPYNKPQIFDDYCSLPGVTYTDEVFVVAEPSCYKIFRTWIVADICQCDPLFPDKGKWMHKQKIVVMDTIPPVLTCMPLLEVPVGNDCKTGAASIPGPAFVDCNPNVKITHDSKYGLNLYNASGNYPLGKTTITFKANDQCGNYATCKMDVVVKDLTKPTVICKEKISTDLASMGGDPMVVIPAAAYNAASKDNCTPNSKLKYSFNPEGTQPTMSFTCQDVGLNEFKVWVIDESGNKDVCDVKLMVGDNFKLCPDSIMIDVGGTIMSVKNEQMPEVQCCLLSSGKPDVLTDASGQFAWENILGGKTYIVQPLKKDKPGAGLNTFDLVLLQRHILGIKPLSNPYAILAGDVDESGHLSAADVLQIRQLILGQIQAFSSGKSWSFLPSSHAFANPADPFQGGVPKEIMLQGVSQAVDHADFLAYKLGDVDQTASAGILAAEDRDAGTINLEVEDFEFQSGEMIAIPFTINCPDGCLGFQFDLKIDTAKATFAGWKETGILTKEHIALNEVAAGHVRVSWSQATPQAYLRLGTLYLQVKQDGQSSTLLSLDPGERSLKPQAYDVNETSYELKLDAVRQKVVVTDGLEVFQNEPNPFSDRTLVRVMLPSAMDLTYTVTDVDGKQIWSEVLPGQAGRNEILLDYYQLGDVKGVLFCKLQAGDQSGVIKLIRN